MTLNEDEKLALIFLEEFDGWILFSETIDAKNHNMSIPTLQTFISLKNKQLVSIEENAPNVCNITKYYTIKIIPKQTQLAAAVERNLN